MKLVEVSENQKSAYNHFIASQMSGSFLQSWEWGQWQEAQGHKAFRFFGFDGNKPQEILFAVQLLKHNISKKRYYLYAPYGPVVNFQFSIFNFQSLVQELQKRFPDAMFIRIEPKNQPSIQNLQSEVKKSFHIQPTSTLVLDLRKPIGQLLKEMHPKTRYNIRLAQKHCVEVTSDLAVVPGHGLYWSEAIKLIVQTAQRQKFKTFPAEYYKRLLDFFAMQNSQSDIKIYVYRALFERELLASAVMVDFSARGGSAYGGGTRTYLFGGSGQTHREVMAPYLLHFKAIEDAKNSGLEIYDFWGLDTLSEKNPGFARFKLGFAGNKLEYPGAFDIVLNKNQYMVYKGLRTINRWRLKFV